MGTTDLYAEDFPHGTPEGYELGCRGSACPNHLSEHMTCRDASIRSRSDYGYRQALAAGTATTLRPEAAPQPPKAMTPPVSRPPIPTPPQTRSSPTGALATAARPQIGTCTHAVRGAPGPLGLNQARHPHRLRQRMPTLHALPGHPQLR